MKTTNYIKDVSYYAKVIVIYDFALFSNSMEDRPLKSI